MTEIIREQCWWNVYVKILVAVLSMLFLMNSSFAVSSSAKTDPELFSEFLCECRESKDAAKCFAIALDELKHNKYMDPKTKVKLHKKAIDELKKSLADLEAVENGG
ncbi:MAG: hypothetical protein GY694_00440 [Gammaproteobacteria bacterium]|nr:hypothetical protein [Gammaproteobacteria bacterium]